eukprot:scaffold11631_cov143-Skeletonema_marinoi.AAC.1
MPQTQTQAKPAKAKPSSISKNQFSINPNINLPSHHLGLQDITASPELVRVKEESVSQSAVDTRERLCSTQEECAVPSPRTTMEVLQSDNYSGSHYCVQCARRKKLCVFDGDKQKCQLCEVDGLSCQVLGKTWLHSHAESKLGRRDQIVKSPPDLADSGPLGSCLDIGIVGFIFITHMAARRGAKGFRWPPGPAGEIPI